MDQSSPCAPRGRAGGGLKGQERDGEAQHVWSRCQQAGRAQARIAGKKRPTPTLGPHAHPKHAHKRYFLDQGTLRIRYLRDRHLAPAHPKHEHVEYLADQPHCQDHR